MIPEHHEVIGNLRERIISVVLKTFEVDSLRVNAGAAKFVPVGFHLSNILVPDPEQLSFACVLSLKAGHSTLSRNETSFEMNVFGEPGFENPYWEIQQISGVRASAQHTLKW